ncbi:MAG: hypothetical protein JWO10_127 [Microbacteriaceae bacterium]|nr:hypothetical protein [Microbacteriaceae bacterium]
MLAALAIVFTPTLAQATPGAYTTPPNNETREFDRGIAVGAYLIPEYCNDSITVSMRLQSNAVTTGFWQPSINLNVPNPDAGPPPIEPDINDFTDFDVYQAAEDQYQLDLQAWFQSLSLYSFSATAGFLTLNGSGTDFYTGTALQIPAAALAFGSALQVRLSYSPDWRDAENNPTGSVSVDGLVDPADLVLSSAAGCVLGLPTGGGETDPGGTDSGGTTDSSGSADSGSGSSAALAATGADYSPVLIGGSLMLAMGVTGLLASRRRARKA